MFKNIIITGGLGFIGLYVVEKFEKEFPNSYILIIDNSSYCSTPSTLVSLKNNTTISYTDITDFVKLENIFKSFKPDLIIHLAAETHVDLSYINSSKFIDTNVHGTHNMLECSRKFSPKSIFVHMSTDEVYGSCKDNHTIVNETSLLNPTNPYSATKASAEMLVNAYTISYNLKSFIIRCNNAYGPRQFPEKIIPKFITLLKEGKKCEIHGDGNKYSRHYIYASDIALAIYTIIISGKITNNKPEIYNISSDKEYTNIQVLKDILKCLPHLNKYWNEYCVEVEDRPFNDYHYHMDSNKLKKLGFSPKITWEQGLQETVKWYTNNSKCWTNDIYKIISKCRVCNNDNLKLVLDLGYQSPANEYLSEPNIHSVKYPLKLNVCDKCWHMQLSHLISPEKLFKTYSWMSGISEQMREYFKDFAKIVDNNNESNNKIVLEIACNDGSQLDAFKAIGYKTIGIDPAENLKIYSESKGHQIISDFFSEESVSLLEPYGPYNAIVAQNVFAHVDNINGFLKACKKLMTSNTKLYIQTSQANMVMNGEFDTIYHEHVSFFSARSMRICLENNGLCLEKIELPNVHGTSYLFICSIANNNIITEQEIYEQNENRYCINTYLQFELDANNRMRKFKEVISNNRKNNYMIVGYGASAKANVFLSSSNIELDYIVDDNFLKQGKYAPNINTLIISQDKLKEIMNSKNKLVIVILAWNNKSDIENNIIKISKELQCDIPSMILY
jgi:dTDP-glucose 4,6-dehydratase